MCLSYWAGLYHDIDPVVSVMNKHHPKYKFLVIGILSIFTTKVMPLQRYINLNDNSQHLLEFFSKASTRFPPAWFIIQQHQLWETKWFTFEVLAKNCYSSKYCRDTLFLHVWWTTLYTLIFKLVKLSNSRLPFSFKLFVLFTYNLFSVHFRGTVYKVKKIVERHSIRLCCIREYQ